MFSPSGIQVRLHNYPRGENAQDAELLSWFEFWLDLHIPFGVGILINDNHLTIDNNDEAVANNILNAEDHPVSPQRDPSPRVLDNLEPAGVPISANDLENHPALNYGFNAEDYDEELSITSRRRMRKRKYRHAVRHRDTSSENERSRPLRRRKRRQKSSKSQNREISNGDSPPGPSGSRKELDGRKKKRGKNRNIWQRKRSRKDNKSRDCGEERVICQLNENSIQESVSGPSRKKKRLKWNKRQHNNFQDKYPFDDPESSDTEYVPRQPRKRTSKRR